MIGQKVISGALKVPLQYTEFSISPWLPVALFWSSELSGNTDNSGGQVHQWAFIVQLVLQTTRLIQTQTLFRDTPFLVIWPW